MGDSIVNRAHDLAEQCVRLFGRLPSRGRDVLACGRRALERGGLQVERRQVRCFLSPPPVKLHHDDER
jgi:hypothetical protein